MAGCGLRGPRCLGVVCVAVVCVGVAGCDPFQRIIVRVLVSVVWVLWIGASVRRSRDD